MTLETLQQQFTDIIAESRTHGCCQVLLEGVAEKSHMSTLSAFQIGYSLGISAFDLAIAFCLYGYEIDDISRFVEIVAENRGVNIRFFGSKSAALEWLEVTAAA